MSEASVAHVTCLRHAEAEINVEGRLSSAIPGTPLTARGRDQAAGAAETLRERGVAHVYTSPVGRARQTAEIIGGTMGLPVTVVDGLHEVGMGNREGTLGTNRDFFEHPSFQSWIRGTGLDVSFSGGETGLDIVTRMFEALDSVADAHPGESAVVVSHGGSLVAGLLHLCENLTYSDVAIGVPANGAAIQLERRDGKWSCLSWP